jgi:hypothetical protein
MRGELCPDLGSGEDRPEGKSPDRSDPRGFGGGD